MLKKIIESYRDWGRDCWCEPGEDNTCGKRFDWQLGSLPHGYDHKYTYSRIGYNLKVTDMQAAVGVAQLGKLNDFVARRRDNFAYLRGLLEPLADVLVLPEATPGSDPKLVRLPDHGARRPEQECSDGVAREPWCQDPPPVRWQSDQQPAYASVPFRIVGDLKNADRIMYDTFWVGIFPGIDRPMLYYVAA